MIIPPKVGVHMPWGWTSDWKENTSNYKSIRSPIRQPSFNLPSWSYQSCMQRYAQATALIHNFTVIPFIIHPHFIHYFLFYGTPTSVPLNKLECLFSAFCGTLYLPHSLDLLFVSPHLMSCHFIIYRFVHLIVLCEEFVIATLILSAPSSNIRSIWSLPSETSQRIRVK
jgi:hypothetical protein